MKKIIFILFLSIPFIALYAQDSIATTPPKIITKLKIGNTATFDTKSIKIIKLIGDSRCPVDATCIWEGEVTLLVGLYENDALKEEKELVFSSKNINPDHLEKLLTSGQKTIYAHSISPQASTEESIDSYEYYLNLLVR
ncbi:hypothetical protein [Aquimarina longa]|uniref:hypothetical protein n=1 Tax=Aquimarina longa TaxID=1080221 RepID=UPI000AA7374E|nr:hypothetical protein [Aquimarina longa]